MSNQNKEKKGANKKDDFKINFWNSIKAKILLLVFGAVLLTVLLNLWTVIPRVSSNISDIGGQITYNDSFVEIKKE